MTLVDNILSIVLIAILLMVVSVLLFIRVTDQGSEQAALQDEDFLQDYFATSIDTFLHFNEPKSNEPFNVLLGDYVYENKRFRVLANDTIDIKEASQEVLDELFGEGNYYFRVEPVLSNIEFSFVFDGSNSLQDEREVLAKTMQRFTNTISLLFPEDTIIRYNVYVLSDRSPSLICQPFSTSADITCEVVTAERLYDNAFVPITPPTFGYNTYDDWRQSQPYIHPGAFWEGDWVAGTAYAAEQYTERLINRGVGMSGSLHIIIPVSDELSTSSVADECFRVPQGDAAWGDYNTCALCDDECPVARAETHIAAVTNYLTELSTIVFPVFSFTCSFKYNTAWNNIQQTPFTSKYVDFPVEESLCDEPQCGGCESSPNIENFCFHTSCHDTVREHMSSFANATGGALVDISDSDLLVDEIINYLNDTVTAFSLEIGVLDEERTRFVTERQVLLPVGHTSLTFRTYEDPFVDTQPPSLLRAYVEPWMAHNSVPFTLHVELIDNTTIDTVVASVNGNLITLSPDPFSDEHLGIINATGWAEGDYTITILANDTSGNSATYTDATWLRVNDTDIIPPVITGVALQPPRIIKPEDETNIWVNATDNMGIQSVTVRITAPNGSVHTQTLMGPYPGALGLYGVTITASDLGEYLLDITVTDLGGNTDTEQITLLVEEKKMRVLFVPIGVTSQSQWDAAVDRQSQLLTDKLPVNTCPIPEDHIEFIAVNKDLCSDLDCTCQCFPTPSFPGYDFCGPKVETCYDRYIADTGDSRPFDLIMGLTANKAGCVPPSSSAYVSGCTQLNNPISSSWIENSGTPIHEGGHSLGLCHVGPSGGSCGSPDGVNEPFCPNYQEDERISCIMNYCSEPIDSKSFCNKGFAHLQTNLAIYLGGCS